MAKSKTKKPKKSPPKARSKPSKPSKPTWKAIAFYFDNVVPFLKMMDLDRALDTGVNMFQYELHAEYKKLQQEARRALDTRAIDDIVALARTKRLKGLDEAGAKQMLEAIVGAGDVRYEGAGE